ncbi:MAG: replication-relaxation family protein [Bdellovibrionales bacterium]|nr:replication-relaxation family protein [Bdellovibrionales bacterium]
MKNSVVLTTRDFVLLRDLYESTVLSFFQIRTRHFPGKSEPTASNRLGKLRRADYTRSIRVGSQSHHGALKSIGVIHSITRKGIRALQSRFPSEAFREEPVRWNTQSLSHDLLLTDVLSALRPRHPGARFTNGKLLGTDQRAGRRLPDAVLETPPGSRKIAVELELTGKSERRYREIITEYRLDPRYAEVHYIVPNRSLLERIQSQIVGYRVSSDYPNPDTGKFKLLLLHALLKSSSTVLDGTEEPQSRAA